jgi:DNA-binding transcriptional regulator YdaS (Cro superfamily)
VLVTFRDVLAAHFAGRMARNQQYSLRAFARALRVDHSTLSQWISGRRPLTPRAIEQTGWRLGLTPRDLRAHFARAMLDRDSRRVLALVAQDQFEADVPWIAAQLGLSTDEVNITLQRLLRRGLLQMETPRRWRVT